MKTIKFTTQLTVTNDFYEKELKDLKNDVLSGKFQRQMVEHGKNKGVKKAKATFEEIR